MQRYIEGRHSFFLYPLSSKLGCHLELEQQRQPRRKVGRKVRKSLVTRRTKESSETSVSEVQQSEAAAPKYYLSVDGLFRPQKRKALSPFIKSSTSFSQNPQSIIPCILLSLKPWTQLDSFLASWLLFLAKTYLELSSIEEGGISLGLDTLQENIRISSKRS